MTKNFSFRLSIERLTNYNIIYDEIYISLQCF